MKIFITAIALLSVVTLTMAQTKSSPIFNDNKAAFKVVESLFAAMKAKDAQAISALFLKEGQLVAIDKPRTGDGPSATRIFTGDAFAKSIADSKGGEFIEQMNDPEVKIFGDMALVYGRYTFHVGEKFSHCGTNSFQLVRTGDGWKIGNAASTLEFNCGEMK
jgi:ketosteroid isomerase-like protein